MLPFLVARLQNKQRNCGRNQPMVIPVFVENRQRQAGGWRISSIPRAGEAMLEWQPHRAGGGGKRSWRKRVGVDRKGEFAKSPRSTRQGGWNS